MSRPDVLILVGPTASGKTTIADALRARGWAISRPVTTTSRAPRPGEVDGVHYHFATREAMLAAQAEGAYLEQEEFRGNRYGLSWAALRAAQAEGLPVLIVEPKGVNNLRGHVHVHAICVEIDAAAFARRLAGRPAAEVAARASGFADELADARAVADERVWNGDGAQEAAIALLEARLRDWGVSGPALAPTGRTPTPSTAAPARATAPRR